MECCCCTPVEDSEHVLLRRISFDKQDGHESTGTTRTRDGYQDLTDPDEDKDDKGSNKTFCGYGLGLLAVCMATASLACTQALDESIPHSELNAFRFSAQFSIITPFVIGFRKCDVRVERNMIGWLVFAAIMLTANSYTHFAAAYYLPIGIAGGIPRSVTLTLTYVISCVTKRTVKWYEFIATTMCICGIVMVTQPEFIFHDIGRSILSSNFGLNGTFQSVCHIDQIYDNSSTVNQTLLINESKDHYDEVKGYIFCLFAGVGTTIFVQIINRKLKSLSIFVFNFWACIFGIISSFTVMGATETPFFPTLTLCVIFLFVHMFSAGLDTVLVYRTYQLLDPVVALLIETLQISFTFIFQYTLLSGIHPGHANPVEFSGACFIFVGNALVPTYLLIQQQLDHRKSDTGKVDR